MKKRQHWQLWAGGVSGNAMDMIEKAVRNLPLKKGVTFKASDDERVRNSDIGWVNDSDIRSLLYNYVWEANVNAFNVNVINKADIQYTEYRGGHYDWHIDTHWGNTSLTDRKLTVTVQLSDPDEYEGGNFEFCEVEMIPDEAKKKGSVLVFPSYLKHRVTPVTKGIRKSLVAWFEGEHWR